MYFVERREKDLNVAEHRDTINKVTHAIKKEQQQSPTKISQNHLAKDCDSSN